MPATVTPSGTRLADAIAENLDTTGGKVRACPDCGHDYVTFCYARNPRCIVCRQDRLRARWAERKRSYRARQATLTATLCAHCGQPFEPKRSTARFCSTACRVAAHRQQDQPQPPQLQPLRPAAAVQRAKVPDNLKQSHQREQKRIRERWQPIAEHLRKAHDLIRAEKERLCKEYAGAQGSLMMTRRWQQMAEIWAESGLLDQFAEITGEPKAASLDGLLSELERSSRMANSWISCIAVYTGCKPDPTRYQPPTCSLGRYAEPGVPVAPVRD